MITKPLSPILLFGLLIVSYSSFGQNIKIDQLPVRGLCIEAPRPNRVKDFVRFIDEELSSFNVNTLILRIDWNYQYKSHPELKDSIALSSSDVKQLVNICKKHNINLIPQINLLGHQSWASTAYSLITVYPEFDETPHVKMPKKHEWPNEDGLYCKSYCPLHPGVHKIVFELVDEICEVFEASHFHAGMDEVFYIGNDNCPRCSGRDKAELFAGEVNKIRNHLALNNITLMIWGDRLLDGKSTGMGMWEASMNNTHRAIDMIAKDVFICDWHYERAEQSAVYFAMKGFSVATCPYNKADVAMEQIDDMVRYRENANPELLPRYQGIIQTIWSGAESFMDRYYLYKENPESRAGSVDCTMSVFERFSESK
ncbi:MAG: family 20 glycosylhydrolase [Bacteroidota bacterium]|nr:family 20 glycosylhydrolase [Bacteroidota bacterium]